MHVSEIREIWKFVNYISSEIPDPMIPPDELIKTVAGLKKDLEYSEKQDGEGIVTEPEHLNYVYKVSKSKIPYNC